MSVSKAPLYNLLNISNLKGTQICICYQRPVRECMYYALHIEGAEREVWTIQIRVRHKPGTE